MTTVEAAAEVRQAQEGRQRSNTSPEVGRVGGAQRPPKEPAERNAACEQCEVGPVSPSYLDPGPRSIACAVALIVSALAMLAFG